MKRILAITFLCTFATLGAAAQANNVPKDVQDSLIALDKQWGQAGSDTAKLDKIIGQNVLAVGTKGEDQDKQKLIEANKATSADLQNPTYTADDYKFSMLSPNVIVMTHRAVAKGTQNGKEVTDSHRSLHVFQKVNGRWQVVANAQVPIAQ